MVTVEGATPTRLADKRHRARFARPSSTGAATRAISTPSRIATSSSRRARAWTRTEIFGLLTAGMIAPKRPLGTLSCGIEWTGASGMLVSGARIRVRGEEAGDPTVSWVRRDRTGALGGPGPLGGTMQIGELLLGDEVIEVRGHLVIWSFGDSCRPRRRRHCDPSRVARTPGDVPQRSGQCLGPPFCVNVGQYHLSRAVGSCTLGSHGVRCT